MGGQDIRGARLGRPLSLVHWHGDLKCDQTKRFDELETANARLCRVVSIGFGKC